MLCVLFQAGGEFHAVPAERVVRVAPYARLEPWAGGHRAVAGALNLGGERIPVVDAGVVLAGRPSAEVFGTRILIVDGEADGRKARVGVLGEGMTGVADIADRDFSSGVAEAGGRRCRCVRVEELLPGEVFP